MRQKMRAGFWGLVVCGFLGFAAPAHALLILDNMVFIGPKSGAAVFKIKNTSKEAEAYRLEWTQLRMTPSGGREKIAPGEIVPGVMPADSFMYVAPRRLLLMPDQVQHVRFMVRRAPDMAPGEYRSYIGFNPEVVPKQFNPAEQAASNIGSGKAAATMSLLSGYRIPVFFLHGETSLSVRAENIRLAVRDGRPSIEFTFVREGNRSALGSVEVTCDVNGVPIKITSGEIRVFTEVNSRDLYYYLDKRPEGCATLNVDYTPHNLDPDFVPGQPLRLGSIPAQ